jgi:DNA-directed RNA polymerase subunit RPC12/RpoP
MPDEQRAPAGDAGSPDPARDGGETILTLVCETCGKDYFFDGDTPSPGMRCGKCGSTVFRSFHDRTGDEAADDFRESTARDLDPDDAEGDVLPGDILDLDNV